MAQAFAIRPAVEADIPAITAIYAGEVRHGTASFEIEPPDVAEMRRRFGALMESGYPYLAAAEDDKLLGYAYAGPYRPRPAYRFTVENSVYVAAEARGRRVGSALMAALVGCCEALSYRQIIAVIGDSANHASIQLHARAGFAMVGTFTAVGWKHGRWLDSVLMQRALGPGAAEPPKGQG